MGGYACVYMHLCVCRAEVDVRCLPPPLSTFLFEVEEGALLNESGSLFTQKPVLQNTGPLLNNREFSIHGRAHSSF